jgi:hypothetical protein
MPAETTEQQPDLGALIVAVAAAIAMAAALTGGFGQSSKPSNPSGESGTSMSPSPSRSA